MIDVKDKVKALEEKALKLSESRKIEAKKQREYQWQTLKESFNDGAEFLLNVNRVFGKPAATHVEIGGKVLIHTGEFDKPKDLSVPNYTRSRQWRR